MDHPVMHLIGSLANPQLKEEAGLINFTETS